jgi:predicted nucleic acid-binding protein
MDENLKGHLLDTNILIYHLKGDIPEREIEKIESILKHSFIISVITKIEFLGWRKHTFDGFLKAQEFLRHAAIIPVDSELADLAIELRRNNNIKLADALIAATALFNDLVLVTGNEDDFKALEELEIYNPLT